MTNPQFIPAENKDIYHQRGDIDCPLYALVNGFRLEGIPTTVTKLRKIFRQEGFHHHSWGFFFPAIALYLLRRDIDSRYITYKNFLDRNKITTKIKACDLLNEQITLKHPHDKELRSILIELRKGQALIIKECPVGFDELTNNLYRKSKALVVVESHKYYKISDIWLHAVLCIRENSKIIKVYDPYLMMGHRDYRDWSQAIDNAINFNWNKWEGELIAY